MTLPQFLRICRDLNLDGVELTSYYFPSTDNTYLAEIKRQAHREGLAISGTAVGSDFAQPDPDRRREHVQMTLDWIQHSVTLGAPTLRVFAGGVRAGQTHDEAASNVVACLQECAEAAWQHGVMLALENHGGLTESAEGTLRLLRATDRPAVGLNLDFGNFHGDMYSQFEACAPYAVATHAKSHATIEAGRPETRVSVDYNRVRDLLNRAGYRGFIAIEYEEAEPADTAVPRFVQELQAAFGRGV
jgi:sugar phosphate isomerase/epimerase